MENIIKQGYLKKARPTEPDSTRPNFCNSFLQMFEPSRWYVFVLRNATPYLEIFDKEESVFNSQPSAKINLSDCYKITYTMARTNKTWTFCIFLENRIIELSADTRDQMQDWCNHLERTLQNFGKLKQQTEHIYSEYPVKYTPRSTGLEQEQALEAATYKPPSETSNDYQEFDFMGSDETDVKFNGAVAGPSSQPPRVPDRPKSYYRSELIGAEGGHDPNDADNDSDDEPDTSEDDFVGKDFFVSNKVPPVPVRSCSAYIPDHLASQLTPSSKEMRQNFCKSVPPLPQRRSTYDKGPSFIESQPKPPPRRKKDKSATITRKISGATSIDNIENLDDGYDSVVHLRKTEEKRRSLEENWYTFGEEPDDNLGAHISNETGLFVNLPTKKTSRSNTPTPTNFLQAGPDFDPLRKQRRSSSDSGNGLHNLASGRDASASDSKDENYNDQKQDLYQFAKPMPLERDSLYDLSSGVRPRSRSPPLYDFGRGTNPEKSHDTVVGTPIPPPPVIPAVSSSLTPSSSSHNRFSETDSLYSIPKSAKPVAGLSTEEVYRPASQNARRSSPGPDALYAIPQKFGGASRQTNNVDEHNLNKTVQPGAPSSPKHAGVGGKSPTETSMISRPLPKIPLPDPRSVKQPEPKDASLKPPVRSDNETEESKNSPAAGDCRPTSPSHDGFHFNFVTDGSDSKSSTLSTSSGGAQSTGTPIEDDTIYEDATGRRNVPPVPPKRIPVLGRKGGTAHRSVSVYIPSKGSGDLARLEPLKQTLDDETGSRNKVLRQMSLQERQHIPARQSSTVHAVVPLKQSQVELLCEEQKQHGIELSISNKSAWSIALVEFFNGIWVAGWDMRHFPRLADKLHIGDQLISVEDIRVGSVMQAQKLIRQTRAERVSIVVKRLPYAKVLAIRRNEDGERLGITREGGTAEITYVDPNGLAGHVGLTRKTQNVDGTGECNWALTEINCRPLNLSLKGNEIEHLLNAVGKDISVVVQPVTFMKDIKRQLKKLKNYKEYLAP